MKTEALYRLLATAELRTADASDVEPSEWWTHLPEDSKKEYIDQHPNSKYADQAIKEGQETEHTTDKASLKPDSPERKAVADGLTKNAPAIASTLKKTFPKITHALGALKNLATGKPLEHEHKEVLHELGQLALKSAAGKYIGGEAIQVVADIGITAVAYGIENYKKKQEANKNKDSVEAFIESIGEGAAKAPVAPIPEEHAKTGSEYRAAIAKQFKEGSKHVAEVLNRSFPHMKPAINGLNALVHGQSMDEHQKKAVKSLGKHALMISISTLPGGLAAHITAGIGASAVNYAIKRVKAAKAKDKEKHPHPGSIVVHFIEAIGEGLEHAAVMGHLGGHHGGSE
jgi:hypothetical protein